MASTVVNLSAKDVMKNITITVKVRGLGGYRLRFWLGTQLIRAAAFVLQCRVEICGREVGE